MKTFITLALALFIAGAANAQYCCTEEGKVLTYTDIDAQDNNRESTSTVKILTVTTGADGAITTRQQETETMPDGFKDVISYSGYVYTPADGLTMYHSSTAEDFKTTLITFIKDMAESQGVTPTADQMHQLEMSMRVRGSIDIPLPAEIPADPKFKDSKLTCRGNNQIMSIAIKDGKYEGMETVTTPAGEFECMKIAYTLTQNMGETLTYTVTDWFAKGIGLVKSVKTDKKGNLAAESNLKSIQ